MAESDPLRGPVHTCRPVQPGMVTETTSDSQTGRFYYRGAAIIIFRMYGTMKGGPRRMAIKNRSLLGILLMFSQGPLWAQAPATEPAAETSPRVSIQTSEGAIVLALERGKAPKSVENFLRYVREGFYEGTIFHRVIQDFMIQGGGFTRAFERKPTHAPIPNEADNGLKNLRGTVAMARTADPHSATAQFFINTVDNAFLDHRDRSPRGWGYAVFGTVVDGMDTVDRIEGIPTGSGGPFRRDVPSRPVVIEKITILPPPGSDRQPAANE